MPLFHLHIHQCGRLALDEEGLELPNLVAARDQAIAGARAIMCEELARGQLNLGCYIKIEDSYGQVLATVPFRETITFEG